MDILQISVIGLTGMFLTLVVKEHKPELAALTALATGVLIILPTLDLLWGVVAHIVNIASVYNVDAGHIAALLKIIAIAYIAQFSGDMCVDAGQSALAAKIEFGARILILFYALPIATTLLELIVSILP